MGGEVSTYTSAMNFDKCAESEGGERGGTGGNKRLERV